MEERVRSAVEEALRKVGAESVSFVVEWPADLAHGDYATNAALAAAKSLGQSPKDVAAALRPYIQEALGSFAADVEIAGPGFINITLARTTITDVVDGVGEAWGNNLHQDKLRVMVEYTDPNPFKEMHIGHLMSNVIGESVARLMSFAGATVFRASYQGDVGPHVAKALWGLREKGITEPATAKEIGEAYAHGSRAYDESPEAKTAIDAINKAVYVGEDHELMELWRKGREVSLAAFEELYATLGTKFDYYFFESEVADLGTRLVKENIENGVFQESQGAVIYDGEKKGYHTLVFLTSQGTPTYEAKELGLAFTKEERCPVDASYILTAYEQVGHFTVGLSALEDIAPALAKKTHHIPHGFLRLSSGKMSSREGNVITAASLINDVIANVSERNSDPLIAEAVGLGAIKYSILKQSAGSDIIFDFDTSLSLEGDSGPYLQYALVRARSVLAQAGEGKDVNAREQPYDIERLLVRFPEVVVKAQTLCAPHVVAQYLTQLAGSWNSFYAHERIIGGEYEGHKLQVARAFMRTMEQGLYLLGIPAPEKM